METVWTQVDGIDRGRKLCWLGWFHDCVLPQSPAKDPVHDGGVYRRCLCQVFPAASCLLNKLHLASL